MYVGIHVKHLLFVSEFSKTSIIATDFRKVLKYKISWKSVQWEPSCSMLTSDGQADLTQPVVPFRNFAYAPKN
jgi:hypothetical protein